MTAHSAPWVASVWASFCVSVGATAIGVWMLSADAWVKGFFGMGLLFTVGSTLSLAKTLRDVHESQQVLRRIDEARVTKLIAEHDPNAPLR